MKSKIKFKVGKLSHQCLSCQGRVPCPECYSVAICCCGVLCTACRWLLIPYASVSRVALEPHEFCFNIQSNLGSRTPRIMNNSVYEQIFRTQSISDDVLCLELWTRKPSTSWSDKLGVSASAVFVEEWSSPKYPQSATLIGEGVSSCVAFVHSNSLYLLLKFSVFCVFYKLLNRTPWSQRKIMLAAKWKEKIPISW
jgi:hypothetical protein